MALPGPHSGPYRELLTMDLKTRYQPKQVKVLTPDRQFCALRYSPCGKVLAAGAQDGSIRRWVDVIWTSSAKLRQLDPKHIRIVYDRICNAVHVAIHCKFLFTMHAWRIDIDNLTCW